MDESADAIAHLNRLAATSKKQISQDPVFALGNRILEGPESETFLSPEATLPSIDGVDQLNYLPDVEVSPADDIVCDSPPEEANHRGVGDPDPLPESEVVEAEVEND